MRFFSDLNRYFFWVLSGLLLASCQLTPKPKLIILPLHVPAHSVLIQGKIIKDGQVQAINALLESDSEHIQIVMLNPFGQRSRTLNSDAKGWSSQHHIPFASLIDDAEFLTGLLCVFAGPAHSHLHAGHWQGFNLAVSHKGATTYHEVNTGADPWRGLSSYRKRVNERLVFELQLQAAEF
ncbi:MAG TPA: hypothetical protein VIZ65_02300 [Cellvibrionaceae bacterium]